MGELANGEPLGLTATSDTEALIAEARLRGLRRQRPRTRCPRHPRLRQTPRSRCQRGHHQHHPVGESAAYEPREWRDQLATAAQQGQVSLYASGIEPGFAADYLPLVLSTQSAPIEKIHAYEMGLYDDYGVPDIMSDALGFGRPLDHEPWIGFPGAIAGNGRDSSGWSPTPWAPRSTKSARRSTVRSPRAHSRPRWALSRPAPVVRCGCGRSAWSAAARPSSSSMSRAWRTTSLQSGRGVSEICPTG